ncbi:hypothetical protein QFC24_006326 [Naganishia onofrii]|uniref:Uncharacterized protein n=1 Tax=Naganishia onofrii TaxID=1851511 RepID=A0ACC2X3S0_9TREE|nr:hypothetical protein QFC24_006326 [Naganishia onofrii]
MESVSVSCPLAIQAVLAQVAEKVKAFTPHSQTDGDKDPASSALDTDCILPEHLVTKIKAFKQLCEHLKAKAETVEFVSNREIETKVQELKAQLKALSVDEQQRDGSFHTASVVGQTRSGSLLFEVPAPPEKTMTDCTAKSVFSKDGKETVVITIEFSDASGSQGFPGKPDNKTDRGNTSTVVKSLPPPGSASFK